MSSREDSQRPQEDRTLDPRLESAALKGDLNLVYKFLIDRQIAAKTGTAQKARTNSNDNDNGEIDGAGLEDGDGQQGETIARCAEQHWERRLDHVKYLHRAAGVGAANPKLTGKKHTSTSPGFLNEHENNDIGVGSTTLPKTTAGGGASTGATAAAATSSSALVASKKQHQSFSDFLEQSTVPGTNPNAPKNVTPLHASVRGGHLEVVKYLIEQGAKFQVTDPETNRTPLHDCAMRGYLDVTEYLVKIGANMKAPDNEFKTPLQLAAEHRHVAVVEFLASQAECPFPHETVSYADEVQEALAKGKTKRSTKAAQVAGSQASGKPPKRKGK